MRACRVDANHRAIVEALEKVGCLVLDLSRIGHGCPDLLVRRGASWWLVEVKVTSGKLRPAQVAFAQRWTEAVFVVRSVDDALKLVLA